MNETKNLRRKIVFYQIIIVVIIQLLSFAFVGSDLLFSYGLALGTAIVVINLGIAAFATQWMLSAQHRIFLNPAMFGYFLRLLLFGGAFYICMITSYMSALGMIIAYIANRLALFIIIFFDKNKI